MTKLTNPHTLDALRELGCLDDESVDNAVVARLLAARLEADHIADSLDGVAAVETTVGQLATMLIGSEDPEFVDHIRPLLSAGAGGKVQQALSNGYMLCAGRTNVTISIEGELVNKSITTRFLSADHDVLQKYVLDRHVKRVESMAKRTLELTELVEVRQPEMAERLGTFTERLTVTWQRAIGSGGQ